MAARSVDSISAASHSKARAGRSSRTSPTESNFQSPFSRTSPICTRITLAPVVSVASRTCTGRKARLSEISAPPICNSAAPPGVSHWMVGRPEALGSREGLPGSFKSTKRFMSATRAAGVRCAKVSALRAVRNLEKDCSLCEQAADKASRKAAVGASGAIAAAVGAAVLTCGAELLSCAGATDPQSNSTAAKANLNDRARRTTSILCRGKNGRQALREGRARHHFVATRGASLRGQVRLHVRQEADHPNAIFRGAQPLDRRDRLVSRIEIHDQQFLRGSKETLQRVGSRGDLHFDAEMLRRFRQLHLKKQVIHQRYDPSHWPSIIRQFAACLSSTFGPGRCATMARTPGGMQQTRAANSRTLLYYLERRTFRSKGCVGGPPRDAKP